MNRSIKSILCCCLLVAGFSMTSCRDTTPGDPDDPGLGMTSDSVFTETDTINNYESTEGADTELDGE